MPRTNKQILEDLQDRHMAERPEVLDDDLPDDFNDWLAEQDLSEEELNAIQ